MPSSLAKMEVSTGAHSWCNWGYFGAWAGELVTEGVGVADGKFMLQVGKETLSTVTTYDTTANELSGQHLDGRGLCN